MLPGQASVLEALAAGPAHTDGGRDRRARGMVPGVPLPQRDQETGHQDVEGTQGGRHTGPQLNLNSGLKKLSCVSGNPTLPIGTSRP